MLKVDLLIVIPVLYFRIYILRKMKLFIEGIKKNPQRNVKLK